jgi:hypothetical protein
MGTGLRFERAFTWTVLFFRPDWLQISASTPRAFLVVGMTFQPSRASR